MAQDILARSWFQSFLDRGYEVDVLRFVLVLATTFPRKLGGIIKKDIFEINAQDLEPYQQVVFLAGLSNDPIAE